jgi:TolA-binding protein
LDIHHSSFLQARFILAVLLTATLAFADKASDQFDFAEGLFIEKDYDSAREEYQLYREKYATGERAAESLFRIGECWFRVGQYAKALKIYGEAVSKHPQSPLAPLAHYNMARAHTAANDFKAAAKSFEAAADAPKSMVREEAMIGQGESLIKSGDRKGAAALYMRFVSEFPDSPQAPRAAFSQAWLLLNAGDAAGAESAARKLLQKYPKHTDPERTKLLLCDALTAQGKFADAETVLKELASVDKVKEEAALRLAWTRFRAGDKAAAAKAFTSFADQYPKSKLVPTARYNAGTAFYELKNYPAAITQFKILGDKHPEAPESKAMRYWLALAQLDAGDAKAALPVFTALQAEQNPANRAAAVLFHLGRTHATLGNQPAAATAYRQLLKDHPQSEFAPRARYGLGTSLAAGGDTDAALTELKAALAAAKDGPLAASARFALAEYQYRAGRPAEAVNLLTKDATAADAEPKVLYRLAWAHYDLEQFKEAEALFVRLADGKSDFTIEAAYLTGRCRELTDRTQLAIDTYRPLSVNQSSPEFSEKAFYRLAEILPVADAFNLPKDYAKAFPQGTGLKFPIKLRIAERCFAENRTEAATLLYTELSKSELQPDQAAAVWYGLAWCHLRQKDDLSADKAFAKAGTDPITDEMIQDAIMQRGEIAYRAKRFDESLKFFATIAEEPKAKHAERAWYMKAWSARENGDHAAAAKAFQAQLKQFPAGQLASDAALRAAESLALTDNGAKAAELLESVVSNPDASEDARLQYLAIQTGRKQWRRVIEIADAYLKKFPESKRAYLAHFHRGLACRAAGLSKDAEAAFAATIAATDTIEAAKSQFNLASMQADAGDFSAAAKSFLRVELLYDYPEIAPRALFHAVDAFVKSGEGGPRRAKIYLRKLNEKYADSEWTPKASKLLEASE